eukprot:1175990-Prorocentrum_minimum.AAC.1
MGSRAGYILPPLLRWVLKCSGLIVTLWPSPHSKKCIAPLPGGGVCGATAAWACPRGSHGDAACKQCVERRQVELVGAPGRHASTDVYDAVVDRETTRRDGQ